VCGDLLLSWGDGRKYGVKNYEVFCMLRPRFATCFALRNYEAMFEVFFFQGPLGGFEFVDYCPRQA
jgi:hypothetical protein